MLFQTSILCALGATAVAAAACNQDNCYRAVARTDVPGRSGFADCVAYLKTTVTPAAVTVTTTSLSTVSLTTTVSTQITVLTSTTVPSTVTQFSTSTSVSTVTVPTTTTANAGVLLPPRAENPKIKAEERRAISSNTVPAYASACSGAVRFLSACSCLGAITVSTITAVGPTSTVGVVSTVTTVSTIIQTSTSTSVVTQNSLTTLTVQTTVQTTATTTAVTTVTPVAVCSVGCFYVEVAGGPLNGYKLRSRDDGTGRLIFGFALTSSDIFSFASDGELMTASSTVGTSQQDGALVFNPGHSVPGVNSMFCGQDDYGDLNCQDSAGRYNFIRMPGFGSDYLRIVNPNTDSDIAGYGFVNLMVSYI